MAFSQIHTRGMVLATVPYSFFKLPLTAFTACLSRKSFPDYIRSFHAVLQQSFRFAVFPKQYITFNPMQYVVMRRKAEEDVDLFSDNDEDAEAINPITPEQYQTLMEYLEERNKPAILPVQIAYYTGLRLGEVCGLT